MRKDMVSVLTERGRRKGRRDYRERRSALKSQLNCASCNENFDEIETRENMRRWAITGWEGKEINWHFRAWHRFLISRVGKTWASVRSEIAEVFDTRSDVDAQVWNMIYDDIEENTFIGDDGGVWFADRFGMRWRTTGEGPYRPIKDSMATVYVNPVDGIICKVPTRNRYHYNLPKHDYIVIDKTHQAHRIHGFWYLIELAPIPEPIWLPWSSRSSSRLEMELATSPKHYFYIGSDEDLYRKNKLGRWQHRAYHDVATADIIETWQAERGASSSYWPSERNDKKSIYGMDGVYAIHRWQMSSNELRRHGLKNGFMNSRK